MSLSSPEINNLCGWRTDGGHYGIAITVPQYYGFRGLLATEPDKPIMLYRAWYDVLQAYPPYPAQQIGDCHVPGTMVLGETTKPIEQVKVGDRVWTGQGRLSAVVSTRAIETKRPLVRIKPDGGLPITCTSDHKMLVYEVPLVSGKRATPGCLVYSRANSETRAKLQDVVEAITPTWVAAGDLTGDHYLLSPVSYEVVSRPKDAMIDRFWATPGGRRLIGYFIGNGNANGGSLELSMSKSDVSDDLMATLKLIGFSPRLGTYGKAVKAWRIRVHSRELVSVFRKHFYADDKSKVFPGWAIGDSAVLGGLWDADGHHLKGGRLAITSVSLSIIHGALATLRSLGFNPSASSVVASRGRYANGKTLYKVEWPVDRVKNRIWRDDRYVCHRVKSVQFIEGVSTVYDIGVADSHHSFIANGFATSNCVSFGHAHANDLLQCIEICFGEPSTFQETDTEFIYGEARKVGNMLGTEDGCYGAAAVKAMLGSGIVSRAMLGSDGSYSGQRAKSWGLHGPPAEYEQMAAKYKLGSVSRITTWEELVAAIWNCCPVTICTARGFTMTRDNQGFCAPKGRWGHCMFISGLRFDRRGACVVQSWGPNTPDGPTDLDQPDFSFWVDKDPIEGILAEGDSWALVKSPDFATRRAPKEWIG